MLNYFKDNKIVMNKFILKKLIILFCIYLTVPIVAECRISETYNMCKSRYGTGKASINPLLTGKHTETKNFSDGDWTITIGFLRSTAIIINYSKHPKINDSDLQTILTAYQTEPWEEGEFQTLAGVKKGWKSKQGYIAYKPNLFSNDIIIEWPEMLKRLKFESESDSKFTKKKNSRF